MPINIIDKEAVIFISANNDVAYSLACAEKYEHTTLVVTENKSIFDFINSLKIDNADLIFLKSKLNKRKNPICWINEYKYLRSTREKYFSHFVNTDIYFRAFAYDLLTCSMVHFLSRSNTCIFAGSLNDIESFIEKKSGKNIYYQMLYDCPLVLMDHMGKKVMGLSKSYFLKCAKKPATLKELNLVLNQYRISVNQNKPYILILDDGHKETKLINNYPTLMAELIGYINEQKYNFKIKQHPRFELSHCLFDFKMHAIDKSIPVEFLNKDEILCVIGHWSIALTNFANTGVPVYSLIKIFDYTSNDAVYQKQERIKYLKQHDKNKKINYISDLSQVFSLIRQ